MTRHFDEIFSTGAMVVGFAVNSLAKCAPIPGIYFWMRLWLSAAFAGLPGKGARPSSSSCPGRVAPGSARAGAVDTALTWRCACPARRSPLRRLPW
ncbi:hypothetical protein ACH58_25365 [Achromobacter xylosoxidans]|nr:hypothetical protein ACH58_25365 [Achromobacter xylosoxidans]